MDSKEFDPTSDLAACQAMAEEFEAYLKSDVLYWQMDASRPGGDRLPKLTVGWFLDDYAKRPNEEMPYYPAQAHTRLAIELLLEELAGDSATEFIRRLFALD